ncbi:hypothetical protein NRIC_21040 [Enterococcus florum]|uniref:Mga helix-turn-helix domain-containing protein n=1 Tax=Enterococcus florum TaxID=2480627 RepID=A0A4P5PLR9_9ENTE|nr:helix-turn-helix domain-containing protein [Enterococcus florum]GCF94213.1 hypothetical protein NRIC_21040 [Enterococcus florum]
MLRQYMEKEIVRKIDLIELLWGNEERTSMELALDLAVTPATVKNDIKTLNLFYTDPEEPLILSSPSGYSIFDKKRNKRAVLTQLYNDSLFVRACCHFLKHQFVEIEKFADKEYISLTKAYELKKEVLRYLEEMGIFLSDDPPQETECRIRFLVTYFQMKLGIVFIPVPKFNQYQFDRLFERIEVQENCLFSSYSKQYASLLFQLDFDRCQSTPIAFDDEALQLLKKTAVYQRLRKPLLAFLKSELHTTTIHEDQLLYYALVINIMNANYVDDAGPKDTYQSYVQLIRHSQKLRFELLVQLFQEEFQGSLDADSLIFEAALITFLRKTLFNLQPLIPEEHIELGNLALVPVSLFIKVKAALEKWAQKAQLNLLFSDDHMKYLASKLYFLVHEKEPPKSIYILTSFYTDYLLANELLTTEYGALVQVKQFNPKEALSYRKNDLILFDTDYAVLKKLPCRKLQTSYIFDLKELQEIRKCLFKYDLTELSRADNLRLQE